MTINCKNCGTLLHGKHCFHCGQKIIRPEDKRLRHLVTEFFHHFTHLDGKFLGTLKRILITPGKVTRDISEGITVPHFKLSALFLIGTIIYYLLPSQMVVSTPANESFEKQVTQDEYRVWKHNFAANKSRSKNITMEALGSRYDERQHSYGKLLVLLFLPMLIPVLWVISKLVKKFNPDNIFTAYDLGVASLEVNSIILYGFYLIPGICIWLATSVYGSETVAAVGIIVFVSVLIFLLFSFFKRAYELAWWQALICLTLLVFAYVYVMHLYGLISFFVFL
jgi:hypothetical protein